MQVNPPAQVSRDDALRGNLVRLECPHELDEGDWDGPVYARLREPRHIQPGQPNEFVVDDRCRRPGWVCDLVFTREDPEDSRPRSTPAASEWKNIVIPYSRLTQPADDLSQEIKDRPLLLLFRFLRFRSCYVTAGDGSDPRRLVEVSLEVFLNAQVVAYEPSRQYTFVTQHGATLRPACQYVCIAAIRQPKDGNSAHVIIPCHAAWSSLISREEFIVGWCHGLPAGSSPTRRVTRFRSRWSEFVVTAVTDDDLQRLLRDTFVPSGSDTTVDFSITPIPLVTEFGRVITLVPLEYTKSHVGPTPATTRIDSDVESDSESTGDILAVGFSRGQPLPSTKPTIVCLERPTQLASPAPRRWFALPPAASDADLSRDASSVPAPASTDSVLPATDPALASAPTASTVHQDIVPVPTHPSIGSDPLVATLLALTQSTQQIVASTQQLIQEQRESQRASLLASAVPSQSLRIQPIAASVPSPRFPTGKSRSDRQQHSSRQSNEGVRSRRSSSRSSPPAQRHSRSSSPQYPRRMTQDRSRSRSPPPLPRTVRERGRRRSIQRPRQTTRVRYSSRSPRPDASGRSRSQSLQPPRRTPRGRSRDRSPQPPHRALHGRSRDRSPQPPRRPSRGRSRSRSPQPPRRFSRSRSGSRRNRPQRHRSHHDEQNASEREGRRVTARSSREGQNSGYSPHSSPHGQAYGGYLDVHQDVHRQSAHGPTYTTRQGSPVEFDRHRDAFGNSRPSGQLRSQAPRGGYEQTNDLSSDRQLLQRTIEDLMAGATTFRPPEAELRVHQVAHVGPRRDGKPSDSILSSFWRMSLLDRVSTIQTQETLRNRYRVTKVTAKMLFAVNFGTRQLDHFLPPPTQSGGGRSVGHDPATWSSADTSPVASIQSIEDLRQTLHIIEEAAVEWYPRPVAEVFRAVYSNSSSRMLNNAPHDLMVATLNLYTQVFTSIFQAIRDGERAGSLVDLAQSIMARGSPDYNRLVRDVIDEGIIRTWGRNEASYRTSTSRHDHRTTSRANRKTGSKAIPPEIKALLPKHDGNDICLRFQTKKGCDFPNCRNAHELVSLPDAVVTHVTNRHGDLKSGHPNRSS
ncbi:hypothetical protein DVH05_000269 [Phytophthora capsici]|nr:hypothetical protein DVH05_000269 [Phytophthora capsici]